MTQNVILETVISATRLYL